jgi:hypothetical protein
MCRMFMDLEKNDGTEPPHALLAPFQKLPRARPRRDRASGTILEVRHGDTHSGLSSQPL